MKKYIDFLFEDVDDQTNTQTNVNDFDTKYNNLVTSLQKLWSNVYTERMLNFSQDTIPELDAKLKNPKYKDYVQEINKIKQKKEESDVVRKAKIEETRNKLNTSKKIDDVIKTLVALGYTDKKKNQEIVNLINSKEPNLTTSLLLKRTQQFYKHDIEELKLDYSTFKKNLPKQIVKTPQKPEVIPETGTQK